MVFHTHPIIIACKYFNLHGSIDIFGQIVEIGCKYFNNLFRTSRLEERIHVYAFLQAIFECLKKCFEHFQGTPK